MNRLVMAKTAKAILYKVEDLLPVGPKDVETASLVCRRFIQKDISATLGYFHTYEAASERITQDYVKANFILADVYSNAFYVSIKPWQLGYDFDAITQIAKAAVLTGHGVHFDALTDSGTDRSFDMLEALQSEVLPNDAKNNWQYSVTLPSRWKRSLKDAERAVSDSVRVRVVKGELQAGDHAGETDARRNYLEILDSLAGRVPEIAIATHDCGLARAAVQLSSGRGSTIRLEMLYGFPSRALFDLARETDVSVGVYVPYGDSLLYFAAKSFVKDPRKLIEIVKERLVGNR